MAEASGKGISVLVIDMFHHMREDEETLIAGFPSYEVAREYAKRRTRDSLEELRSANPTKDIRELWYQFGEDCIVVGHDRDYTGASELDFFIKNPATSDERDWVSLSPARDNSGSG